MKLSYNIGPDSCGRHDKYQENCGVKGNDEGKPFSNLSVAMHIYSNLGAFSLKPPYHPPDLQNLHLIYIYWQDRAQANIWMSFL